MTELRDYQKDFIAEYEREVAAGRKRIIGVAPTGSGKTVIGSEIIRHEADQYRSVLVLAHRREIIAQTSQKLFAHGIRHGIIQAGFDSRPLERVQVASIQTLWSRAIRSEAMQLPPADLLVIDECHHAPARTYRKIIDAYPDAILLGLTATPCRGDGRGLGGIFETIIEAPQIAELVEQGHLVKTRIYAPIDPDLKGVGTRTGDYIESQLAERMDRPKLIGDIVTHWHRYGERRKTVAFAVNVAHSIHLRDEFVRSGVRTEHIDGSTPKDERDATLARLASGQIELVTNCMVLTEGFDLSELGCCILARPTKQMGSIARWSAASCAPLMAKPTPSCSTIAAPSFGMDYPRITSRGRSILIAAPRAPTISRASTSTAAASSNAPNAAPCASAASPVQPADSCPSGRRSTCLSPMASSDWSKAAAPRSPRTITPPARDGTGC
jgi:superfamily II DNA or RNA helicase